MKRYSLEQQNYSIFKVTKNSVEPFVHFFWGKFDFRMFFAYSSDAEVKQARKMKYRFEGKFFKPLRLELLHQHHWYQYVEPTGHGMVLEETLWVNNGEEHYVEFPKNLFRISQRFCADELGF